MYLIKSHKFTNSGLRKAVNLWLNDEKLAKSIYGDIIYWDVSKVTNMSGLFLDAYTFNSNIERTPKAIGTIDIIINDNQKLIPFVLRTKNS